MLWLLIKIEREMSSALVFILCASCVLTQVQSARILCVFPFPAVSHQNVFRAFSQELAKRHELVIITPNPLPKERPPDNITEIDISHTYEILLNLKQEGVFVPKRGVIIDMDGLTSEESYKRMIQMAAEQFNHPEVMKLIESGDKERFDLVIVEALPNIQLIYADLFKAPLIMFSTLFGFPDHYDMMGAAARHPILYPSLYRHKFRNLNFFDKINAIYDEVKLAYRAWKAEEMENDALKKIFGTETRTISQLKNDVNMLFLNAHPIIANNRPVPPNVVFLGAGLHLKPVKELPKDLKSYLDASKRGVIYVSLGTNVPTSLMDKDLLDAFLYAFKALPYDILWKLDDNKISPERIPDNVRIDKWFPQRDMLMHPNIKAFVTQGGLQSTDEAINAGVPLVGIPMLGDQWYNTNKYEELGIGIQLDSFTLKADDILEAVNMVVKNERINLKKLRAVMFDQPQRPLERAVWWTEHVLRHAGAHHLRAPAHNMSYAEYFMVDVLAIVLALPILVFLILVLLYIFVVKVTKTDKKLKNS